MANDLLRDPRVPNIDYLLSSMKIGDWYRKDDYSDRCFDGCDDHLNFNWEMKENSRDMLPSDPFGMENSSGRAMLPSWMLEIDEDIGYIKNNEKSIGDEINLEDANGNVGAPPDALFFALRYLGTRDLLSLESVCKSLHDGIRYDPLLWRSVHVDKPPGESFVDGSLLSITIRAGGNLQSLSLVECINITDDGLKYVFQQNPGLTKLSVLGCSGLTMGGLITNLYSLKSPEGGGIKRLRIGGLHAITRYQYDALKNVLSVDRENQLPSSKPRFYYGGRSFLSLDSDRAIDIEACPKCHKIRQVFNCAAESCKQKRNVCRACTLCIPRCVNCGCCFKERYYMETFCLDFLCLDCLTHILSFPVGEEEDMSSVPPMLADFQHESSYNHFCLYG